MALALKIAIKDGTEPLPTTNCTTITCDSFTSSQSLPCTQSFVSQTGLSTSLTLPQLRSFFFLFFFGGGHAMLYVKILFQVAFLSRIHLVQTGQCPTLFNGCLKAVRQLHHLQDQTLCLCFYFLLFIIVKVLFLLKVFFLVLFYACPQKTWKVHFEIHSCSLFHIFTFTISETLHFQTLQTCTYIYPRQVWSCLFGITQLLLPFLEQLFKLLEYLVIYKLTT